MWMPFKEHREDVLKMVRDVMQGRGATSKCWSSPCLSSGIVARGERADTNFEEGYCFIRAPPSPAVAVRLP